MDEPGPEPRPPIFEIRVPPDLEAGTYSNFLAIWHSAYEFTLDFAITLPSEHATADDPTSPKIPCRVVARVKIPPTLIFNVLQALNQNMTNYEAKFGNIPRLDQ
jgi:hypothetical protein